MNLTIKGQEAIDLAYQAMDSGETITLFGNVYQVNEVGTLRKSISDSLWGEVQLSNITNFRELAKP